MNATGLWWWYIKIGSGNGLIRTDDRSLPEAVLTTTNDLFMVVADQQRYNDSRLSYFWNSWLIMYDCTPLYHCIPLLLHKASHMAMECTVQICGTVWCRYSAVIFPQTKMSQLFEKICLNTLGLRQIRRHCAGDIFNCGFLDEDVWVSYKKYWWMFLGFE